VELSILKDSRNNVFEIATGRENFLILGEKLIFYILKTDRHRGLKLRDSKIFLMVTDYTGLLNEE
jgi:hypothetical protein